MQQALTVFLSLSLMLTGGGQQRQLRRIHADSQTVLLLSLQASRCLLLFSFFLSLFLPTQQQPRLGCPCAERQHDRTAPRADPTVTVSRLGCARLREASRTATKPAAPLPPPARSASPLGCEPRARQHGRRDHLPSIPSEALAFAPYKPKAETSLPEPPPGVFPSAPPHQNQRENKGAGGEEKKGKGGGEEAAGEKDSRTPSGTTTAPRGRAAPPTPSQTRGGRLRQRRAEAAADDDGHRALQHVHDAAREELNRAEHDGSEPDREEELRRRHRAEREENDDVAYDRKPGATPSSSTSQDAPTRRAPRTVPDRRRVDHAVAATPPRTPRLWVHRRRLRVQDQPRRMMQMRAVRCAQGCLWRWRPEAPKAYSYPLRSCFPSIV